MKKFITYTFLAASLLGCRGKSDKEKLKELLKEQSQLNKEIADLQKKIGENPEDGAVNVSPVYTQDVVPSDFSKYIVVQAKVEAENNIIATPRASGIVTKVYVRNGQYVKRGQTLAQLDNSVISQQINEIDERITFLKDIYLKQKSLWDQNIGTEVQLLTAKNNYQSAIKQRETVLSQKSLYKVTAPISGVVDAVDIKVGEIASPGSPRGIRIVNENNLKVVGSVGEGNVSLINSGDRALVIIPDLGDTISGRVSFVSRTIDPISRSFNVEVRIPQSSRFKPNMLAELKIAAYSKPNVISVASNMIKHSPDGDYITVVRDGKAINRKVKTGLVYNGRTEILDGLMLDDKIVTSGGNGLADGDPVEILNP